MTFTLGPDDAGRRVDRVVRKLCGGAPMGAIYRALRTGQVRLDGRRVAPDQRTRTGQVLSLPATLNPAPGPTPPGGESSPAGPSPPVPEILLQTQRVLAVNKPRGVDVHGPGSVAQSLEPLFAAVASPSVSFRPGPVHRLDRNTTGVLLFALQLDAARSLSAALREGRVRKEYLAVLSGRLEGRLRWQDRLVRDRSQRRSRVTDEEGSPAELELSCLAHGRGGAPGRTPRELTLAGIVPRTGRTHQIRVQAAAHGHPLAGDLKYGGGHLPGGYVLHAGRLDVPKDCILGTGPESPAASVGAQAVSIRAPLPLAVRRRLETWFGKAQIAFALADDASSSYNTGT